MDKCSEEQYKDIFHVDHIVDRTGTGGRVAIIDLLPLHLIVRRGDLHLLVYVSNIRMGQILLVHSKIEARFNNFFICMGGGVQQFCFRRCFLSINLFIIPQVEILDIFLTAVNSLIHLT
jgi:hypothetical protein